MPRIHRHDLPRPLLAHLLDRIKGRHISANQVGLLADWLVTALPHAGMGRHRWCRWLDGAAASWSAPVLWRFSCLRLHVGSKVPEDWRTPKPGGELLGHWAKRASKKPEFIFARLLRASRDSDE